MKDKYGSRVVEFCWERGMQEGWRLKRMRWRKKRAVGLEGEGASLGGGK